MSAAPEFDEATQERAALHALGLLAPEEAAEFERQLWARTGLRELVDEMRNGLELVARAEATDSPAPHLRATLLEQVVLRAPSKAPIPFGAISRERVSVDPGPRNFGWIPWALAACLAVAATGAWWKSQTASAEAGKALTEAKELRAQLDATRTQYANTSKRLTELESEASRLRAEVSRTVLAQAASWSRLRVASLSRTPAANPSSPAAAMVAYDPDQNTGTLAVKNLPPPPAGRDYQLWIIDRSAGRPLSAGTFKTQPDGTAKIRFSAPPEAHARGEQFAISVEAEGGKPSPEGPVFLAGG